jgi:hypothetical protein
MPNTPYSLAHAIRREAQRDPSEIVIRSTGGSEPEEKVDPMRGVTDPKKLLKSDTQRIDRNVADPNAPDYQKRPGAPEPEKKI